MIKQSILVTVDIVVFTMISNKLHVLLIKRLIEPYKDHWAIPGGFVLENESLLDAANRELMEETNVSGLYLEQLYSFGDPDRDPRGRVVTVSYMAIVPRNKISINAGSDASEVKFMPMDNLPKLAFDHRDILDYAYQRLRYKLEYTNIAQYLLPERFTLKQLQDVYEIALQQKFDVRNFRKKIDKLGLIQETGEIEVGVKHRPAKLFEFVEKDLKFAEVI